MTDTPDYRHRYHEALVYKIFLAEKRGPTILLSLDEALEVIRSVHGWTRGLKQIVYLVGWQYDGHDSKYPAWGEVNHRLRRPQDATARESLLWLMREARKFNAVVSVHINMCDAYETSPLWREYLESDLLVREADGSLRKGGVWGGEQAYLICKKREWESGLARRRIDALLETLPLGDAGTVHIDVFKQLDDPYHGVTREEDAAAMVKILRYWRSRGVDVTTEWFHHEFAGLVPMAYHLNLSEESRLKYSPAEICGGGNGWNQRQFHNHLPVVWPGVFGTPEAGCLYEEAWGSSQDRDIRSLADLSRFRQGIFADTVPWLFLNQRRACRYQQTREAYEVGFDDGTRSYVRVKGGAHCIAAGSGGLLKNGGAYCLPAVWLRDTWVATSRDSGFYEWSLPGDWETVEVTTGRGTTGRSLRDARLTLHLEAGEVAWISRRAPLDAAGGPDACLAAKEPAGAGPVAA